MNKKKKRVVIAIGVVLVGIIAVFPYFLREAETTAELETVTKAAQSRATMVEMDVVETSLLEEKIKLTGLLQSNEFVDLKPEAAGVITAINFNEGDYVEKGQLLVRLNTDLLEADLIKVQSRLKLSEETEYRQRILLDKKAISQEEYDIAHSELQVLRAEIEQIKAQIRQKEIYAPFSGYIGLRNSSMGDYISTSGESLATLYDNAVIKLEFGVPSRHLSLFGVGTKVYFTVDAYNEVFEAVIYAIDKRLDAETGTLTARAKSDNGQGKLVAGLFASIEMVVAVHPQAMMIPTDAVIPELEGHKVYVKEDGVAQERIVQLGMRTADKVQILAGLAPGDSLVTRGIQTLRNGMPLRQKEFIEDKKSQLQ